MPKQIIRGTDYNFVPMPEGVPEPFFPPDCRLPILQVGWSKAPTGHVEVETEDRTMLKQLIEQLQDADHANVETIVLEYFRHSAGFWMTLDRDGINALINTLRKARDDAFGKDA